MPSTSNAYPDLNRDLSFHRVENAEPQRLSQQQIDTYNEKGFIFPLDVFSDDEAATHCAVFDGLLDVATASGGEDIFHHYLTMHSITPNRSKRTRRAHSIIYNAPGTCYGRISPWGVATNGDLFPISFAHPLLRSAHTS